MLLKNNLYGSISTSVEVVETLYYLLPPCTDNPQIPTYSLLQKKPCLTKRSVQKTFSKPLEVKLKNSALSSIQQVRLHSICQKLELLYLQDLLYRNSKCFILFARTKNK